MRIIKTLGVIYEECRRHPKEDFLIQEGYLFKGTWPCIPKCGSREFLVREVHGGSLAGHYGENKTSLVVKEHYYCLLYTSPSPRD